MEYFNTVSDCDACENQYLCGDDEDGYGCTCYDEGLECEFTPVDMG